jgi:hypothetical protein
LEFGSRSVPSVESNRRMTRQCPQIIKILNRRAKIFFNSSQLPRRRVRKDPLQKFADRPSFRKVRNDNCPAAVSLSPLSCEPSEADARHQECDYPYGIRSGDRYLGEWRESGLKLPPDREARRTDYGRLCEATRGCFRVARFPCLCCGTEFGRSNCQHQPPSVVDEVLLHGGR